jgi:pimeloyl-ACP methyl ester carboxylesterase
MTSSREVVTSDGVRLAVRDLGGRGRDRDLLLVHGLASSSHIFDLVAPRLVEDFHVVAYDQRGHGESGKPSARYGFERVSADAAEVIRALELERPVALGHSWGANVVLELGVRAPSLVAGLILLDGGFSSLRERMDWRTAKARLAPPQIAGMHVDGFRTMVRRSMSKDLEVTPEIEAVALSLMHVDRDGRIRPRLSRANHLRILHALWAPEVAGLWRTPPAPPRVVGTRRSDVREDDRAFVEAKAEAAGAIARIDGPVRFEWIEGIHDVPLQHPDAVAALIRRFTEGTSS